MKQIEFSIEIHGPANRVWFALWDDYHYRNWTGVFCEGSYAVSDWKEGSGIHFLGPDGGGMYSTISKLVPNEAMFFSHIGELKNFEEQALDEKTKEWTGSVENYYLSEQDGITTLKVKMDITEDHLAYFEEAFPKGLAKVKAAAEEFYIHISSSVKASLNEIWTFWISPEHIVNWNHASDDWHTTKAENDFQVGGAFSYRMEAKDGSFGFDLNGTYQEIKAGEHITYALEDGRKVQVHFRQTDELCEVNQAFEPENMNSFELQRGGWQAILDNFKKYTEKTVSTTKI